MEDNKVKARQEQIPQAIQDKVQVISKEFNVPLEEVIDQYLTSLNDNFVQQDPQFKTEEEREEYAIELSRAHFNTILLKSCKYYGIMNAHVLP